MRAPARQGNRARILPRPGDDLPRGPRRLRRRSGPDRPRGGGGPERSDGARQARPGTLRGLAHPDPPRQLAVQGARLVGPLRDVASLGRDQDRRRRGRAARLPRGGGLLQAGVGAGSRQVEGARRVQERPGRRRRRPALRRRALRRRHVAGGPRGPGRLPRARPGHRDGRLPVERRPHPRARRLVVRDLPAVDRRQAGGRRDVEVRHAPHGRQGPGPHRRHGLRRRLPHSRPPDRDH